MVNANSKVSLEFEIPEEEYSDDEQEDLAENVLAMYLHYLEMFRKESEKMYKIKWIVNRKTNIQVEK